MWLFSIGIILIILGFAIIFSPMIFPKSIEKMDESKDGKNERNISEYDHEAKGGAVIMIGPIPIVMGSDSKTALLLMLLALIIMLFWFFIMNY